MIISTTPSLEGHQMTVFRDTVARDPLALVVNGLCKEVLQALPMEFAMEAQSLVAISLEGSVG